MVRFRTLTVLELFTRECLAIDVGRESLNNGRKSLGDLKTTRLPRLDAVCGSAKSIDITTTSVE